MPFDGRAYSDADFIYPYEHHPKAPVTGVVLAKALTIGYYAAREHSRKVLQQSFLYNYATPAADTIIAVYAIPGLLSTSSITTTIADGYAWIQDQTTHLRASVLFGLVTAAETEISARITVTDLTNTATGAWASLFIQAGQGGRVTPGVWSEDDPTTAIMGNTVECAVAFSAATPASLAYAARMFITVELKIQDTVASVLQATVVKPFFVSVYADVSEAT